MKILITSGGTKIPIDKVRDITNMSSGTFGSKIAFEALETGHEVIFLTSKSGKTPFKYEINLLSNPHAIPPTIPRLEFESNYQEHQYVTYDDYAESLEKLIKEKKPDVVILAAAISDYGVENPVDTKVRSDSELIIKLKKLPKLISKVKEWLPTTKLVGFKLLVNSTVDELIDAARKSLIENNCEMVVGNDLIDIKSGKHIVHIVYKNSVLTFTSTGNSNYLANIVLDCSTKL